MFEIRRVESNNPNETRAVYISKSWMSHGIETVTLQPNIPCIDPYEYNSAPNQ